MTDALTDALTDYALVRRSDNRPVLTFGNKAGAVSHYRKIGLPEGLCIRQRTITLDPTPIRVRPLAAKAAVDFSIPDGLAVPSAEGLEYLAERQAANRADWFRRGFHGLWIVAIFGGAYVALVML